MDTDLIPAVCPNCGGKLQVNPGADTVVCQFCGTEHLIRRNDTGDVRLEDFARCPLCLRNDQVEKVSAILHKQTAETNGFIPQQEIYTDSQGRTHSRTVNVQVQSVQTSELARRLALPPAPPTQPKSQRQVILPILAILLLVVGICGFTAAILQYTGSISSGSYDRVAALSSSAISALACGFFPFLISMGLMALWFFMRRKGRENLRQEQDSINEAYHGWQQARSRWDRLYYCGRDDIVFIPGYKTSAAVADMLAYLYATPKK